MAELNQFTSRASGAAGSVSAPIAALPVPVNSTLQRGDRAYLYNGELVSLKEQTFINHLIVHDNEEQDSFDRGGLVGFLPNGNYLVINNGSINRRTTQKLYSFEYNPQGELVATSEANSNLGNILGNAYRLVNVSPDGKSMVFAYTRTNSASQLVYIAFNATTGALQTGVYDSTYAVYQYVLTESVGGAYIWTITTDDDLRRVTRSSMANAGTTGTQVGDSNNPIYIYNRCSEVNYLPVTGGVVPIYDAADEEFFIVGILAANSNEVARVNSLGDKPSNQRHVRWFTIDETTKGCLFVNDTRGGLHFAQISWDAENSIATYQLNGILNFDNVYGHQAEWLGSYVLDGDLHYDGNSSTLTICVNTNIFQALVDVVVDGESLVTTGFAAANTGITGLTLSYAKERMVGVIDGQAQINALSISSLVATLNNPPVYVGIVQSVVDGIADISLKNVPGINDIVVSDEPAPVGSEWVSLGDFWIQKSGISKPYFDGLNTVGFSATRVYEPSTLKNYIGNVDGDNQGIVVEIQSPIDAQLEVRANLSCASSQYINYFDNQVIGCSGVMACVGDGNVSMMQINGRNNIGDPVSAVAVLRSFGPVVLGATSYRSYNGGIFTYDLEVI